MLQTVQVVHKETVLHGAMATVFGLMMSASEERVCVQDTLKKLMKMKMENGLHLARNVLVPAK